MARKPSNDPAPSAPAIPPGSGAEAGDSGATPAAGDGAEIQASQAGGNQVTAGTTPADPSTPAPPTVGETVPARILRDCWLGVAGQLIDLDVAVASAVEASGAVDLHELAVSEPAGPEDGVDDTAIEDED